MVIKLEKESQIVAVAKTWLGTPWQHNAKLKGIGVDCIQFLHAVALESGIDIKSLPTNYARIAQNNGITNYLDDNFDRANRIKEGRILLIACKGLNTHVALATGDKTMIHASSSHRKVIEHEIDDTWFRVLKGIWQIKDCSIQ